MKTFDLTIPLKNNREIMLVFHSNTESDNWECVLNNETKEDIESIMQNESMEIL